MPVKSLMDLATAACVKNIREVDGVGDFLPYESVRRVLLRVDNAPQLRQIELNSPQIEGHTAEIWLKLIEKDYPMEYKATAYKPSDPRNWYKVWRKYKKQHDEALAESEKKLKNALAGLQEDKEKNTSKIVDSKDLPRLPKKRKFGSQRDTGSSTLRFTTGSRTKTNSGASVMRKVRRQVSEIAKIHGVFSRPAARGSSLLASNSQKQVKRAPQSMINDQKRAAQPAFKTAAQRIDPEEIESAVANYEERATFISDSEDGDGGGRDEEDDDDLFDEDHTMTTAKAAVRRPVASALTKQKRPTASTADRPKPSPVAAPTASRGRGLLSNSYKPDRAKALKVQAVAARPEPDEKPDPIRKPPRRPAEIPRREPVPAPAKHTSPPLGPTFAPPSSPPPISQSPEAGLSRKRKAVNVFMRPNKRPK